MKIEKYISALLYRYQCVTVPGFGAFLTEIRPAQIDADTHTFYPPKKLISFNANLKNNDGLLANHIALQEKISYSEAVGHIEQVVDSWFTGLQNREKLSLKNIGEIAFNSEGSLMFIPDTPVNYLTDAFGLSTLVSPAVKRKETSHVEEHVEKEPILLNPERKSSYAYLKYAAVFTTAFFVGGAGFKMYRDQQVSAQSLIVEKAVQEKVNNKIQSATFFIENPLPAVKLTIKEHTKKLPYHVVASAFRSEANADKAVRQLHHLGFEAKRLDKNKFGLYPVLYGSFATYPEAQKSMNHIRRTLNKEAWVLIKEL
jgi:nucleoid DNA-binding protein